MTINNQLTSPVLTQVNPVNIKTNEEGVRIPCPIHKGTDQNFQLYHNESGYCFSQCSKFFQKKDIYEHLGIEYSEEILTLDQFKEAFKFQDDDIRKFSISENKQKGVMFPYFSINNQLLGTKYRKHLDNLPDKFFTTKGFKPILYGSQLLEDIKKSNYVLLVEGESDVISAWRHGIPALGISGSSNWNKSFIVEYGLDKLKQVLIWYEKDEASKGLIEKIGADLPSAVVIEHEKYKDISEMNRLGIATEHITDFLRVANNKNNTAGEFTFNLRNERFLEITEDKEYQKLLLLKGEKEFDNFLKNSIGECGYAGNISPVLAAILSINSKKLNKPFHLQLLAPSGAGKSYTVDTAVKFFPADQIHTMEASTNGAFVYDKTDISKKALYVKELDSVPQGDSSIASAVRNGMSEGNLNYQTTIESATEGREVINNDRKCKSILTTGIRNPEIQTSTRLLIMDVEYSTEQITANMKMVANFYQGLHQPIYPEVWNLYFEALELKYPEDIEVVVPFADKLSSAINNDIQYLDERWNRDFVSLLAAIQSTAILHYRYRDFDEQNRLIATLDDYEYVREALSRCFQVTQRQGVTDKQLEILQTIQKMEKDGITVTQKKLADYMKVKPPFISKQVSLLKKWITVSKGESTTKILSVEVLPDSILLPTRKEVQKAKPEAAATLVKGEVI